MWLISRKRSSFSLPRKRWYMLSPCRCRLHAPQEFWANARLSVIEFHCCLSQMARLNSHLAWPISACHWRAALLKELSCSTSSVSGERTELLACQFSFQFRIRNLGTGQKEQGDRYAHWGPDPEKTQKEAEKKTMIHMCTVMPSILPDTQ